MGLGYALTEDFPADPETGYPDEHDAAVARHPAGQGRAADRGRSSSSRPQPELALRHQGRRRDRPRPDAPAPWPRRSTTADGDWRTSCHEARAGRRQRGRRGLSASGARHARPGLRPPPPLLERSPGGCRRRPVRPTHVPRDPRAGLVAARRRPRPRDAPVVGHARRHEALSAGRPRSSTTTSRPNAIEGSLDRHRRRLRRGRRAGGVRLRRDRPPRARRRPPRAWPRTSGSSASGGRGMVGVHAAFTCSDDTLEAAAGLAARPRRRRAHPRRRGARRPRRRRPPGAPGPATTGCSSTASTSTATCPARSPTTPART